MFILDVIFAVVDISSGLPIDNVLLTSASSVTSLRTNPNGNAVITNCIGVNAKYGASKDGYCPNELMVNAGGATKVSFLPLPPKVGELGLF